MKQIIIGIAIVLGIMYLFALGDNNIRVMDVGNRTAISFDHGKTFEMLD